jgi:hypothetical protein
MIFPLNRHSPDVSRYSPDGSNTNAATSIISQVISTVECAASCAAARDSWDRKTPLNAVDGATIERRIRINRPDDENTRCKGSRAWDPRKDFSQPTQPPTTHSTSNAISPQQDTHGQAHTRRTKLPEDHFECPLLLQAMRMLGTTSSSSSANSRRHTNEVVCRSVISAVEPDEPASKFQQRDNAR